jgi:hypothetical protein
MAAQLDFLINSFQKTINLQDAWYNNSSYGLTVQGEKVIATQFIPEGTYLGEIIGTHTYACDIKNPSPYIITVDDDYVIDGTDAPRSILTMIRNAYYIGLRENCILQITTNSDDGDDKIGMMTMENIYPGQELLY